MPVTIYDIAKVAGVSPATVSRVFNNSTLVSKKTKERVIVTARELGYTTGKEHHGLESKTIAVFVSSVLNPTLTRMIKGVQSVVKEQGVSMIVYDSDGGVEDEIKFLHQLGKHNVSGLVISTPHVSSEYLMAIRSLQIPFVLANGNSTDPDVPCVYINNVEASFHVVQELFSLGHRNLGIISGPEGDLTISRERLQGVRLAYMAAQSELNEGHVVEGDYTVEAGYQAAMTMISSWEQLPTAVFAFNDLMAIGAMQAFQERDILVPDQVSVCGFDGIELTTLITPTLSTLAQPSFQVGQESAMMVIKQMENQSVEEIRRELPYKLVMRESVRKLT